MKSLETFDIDTWEETETTKEIQNKAAKALEGGKVLYFPSLPFAMDEEELHFLNPKIVNPKTKNISYDLRSDRLAGALLNGHKAALLKEMLKRYAVASRSFLETIIPHYVPTLIQGKTSFRPVEIKGRKSSYRKDDTLLHVDSFPSNPTKGQRILRVFTNINHEGTPRIWRIGEPFEDVVKKMAPKVGQPFPGSAYFLKLFGITKDTRSLFDHYMLKMHDLMKGDPHYQKTVSQEEIHFSPGCSWIVFTDQVSHAAMSGQHVLEQTFHLPPEGLKNPATNPLMVLERFLNKKLT